MKAPETSGIGAAINIVLIDLLYIIFCNSKFSYKYPNCPWLSSFLSNIASERFFLSMCLHICHPIFVNFLRKSSDCIVVRMSFFSRIASSAEPIRIEKINFILIFLTNFFRLLSQPIRIERNRFYIDFPSEFSSSEYLLKHGGTPVLLGAIKA